MLAFSTFARFENRLVVILTYADDECTIRFANTRESFSVPTSELTPN